MQILVVDDDPATLELVTQALRRIGHEVLPCGTAESAWRLLDAGASPDMAILDWVMPEAEMTGLELCRRLRNRTDRPYVYILMLTARDASGDLIEALDAGADDYLTKPVNRPELEARLRAGERIVNLQNALLEARERLRIQAMQDPLTRVLNHGAITQSLERHVRRAFTRGTPVSLILADLDEFKGINDTHGHPVGDGVLVEVASRIGHPLRAEDAVGRYGGDEFLVVLPETSSSQAMEAARRIVSGVTDQALRIDGVDVALALSLGVTTWSGPGPVTVRELIGAADRAMYRAKRLGPNVVEYEPPKPDGEPAPTDPGPDASASAAEPRPEA